jgi:prevent-host-death family protein
MHEAKTNLSRLIRAVEQGEEIVIARGTTPVARLVRIEPTRPRREFEFAKGLVTIAPDFDAPLEDMADYER